MERSLCRQRKVGVQRKPEQSICTVLPLLQVALNSVALLACTCPQLKPVLMPCARATTDSLDIAARAGEAVDKDAPATDAVALLCAGAATSAASGVVTAPLWDWPLEPAFVATTTPCAFSPCKGWPRSSRWRSKLSVCPNTSWIQLG